VLPTLPTYLAMLCSCSRNVEKWLHVQAVESVSPGAILAGHSISPSTRTPHYAFVEAPLSAAEQPE